MEEKDRVLTAFRIVDNFNVNMPPGPLPPNAAMSLVVLLSWRQGGDDDREFKHEVSLNLHTPSGAPTTAIVDGAPVENPRASFVFSDTVNAANLIFNLGLPVKEFGKFWFDVILDGEQVTRIPFELIRPKPESAPAN